MTPEVNAKLEAMRAALTETEWAPYVEKLMPGTERYVDEAMAGLASNLNMLRGKMTELKKRVGAAKGAQRALDGSLAVITKMLHEMGDIDVLREVDEALHKEARG